MTIDFQAVNYNADIRLVEFTKKRLNKMEKFFDHILDIEVFTKVLNTSDKTNKQAELKIRVPGEHFMVKKTCKTFEEAVDTCAQSAERLLIKFKTRKRSRVV
jgi:putative sigma-54 modulation protein